MEWSARSSADCCCSAAGAKEAAGRGRGVPARRRMEWSVRLSAAAAAAARRRQLWAEETSGLRPAERLGPAAFAAQPQALALERWRLGGEHRFFGGRQYIFSYHTLGSNWEGSLRLPMVGFRPNQNFFDLGRV